MKARHVASWVPKRSIPWPREQLASSQTSDLATEISIPTCRDEYTSYRMSLLYFKRLIRRRGHHTPDLHERGWSQ